MVDAELELMVGKMHPASTDGLPACLWGHGAASVAKRSGLPVTCLLFSLPTFVIYHRCILCVCSRCIGGCHQVGGKVVRWLVSCVVHS